MSGYNYVHAYKLVEDCVKKLGCTQIDVFIAYLKSRSKHPNEDVRATAARHFEHWVHENLIEDFMSEFCLQVIRGEIVPTPQPVPQKAGRRWDSYE